MKTLSQLTDENLIKLYIDGDNDAFETIINRHKDKIYTSIFKENASEYKKILQLEATSTIMKLSSCSSSLLWVEVAFR